MRPSTGHGGSKVVQVGYSPVAAVGVSAAILSKSDPGWAKIPSPDRPRLGAKTLGASGRSAARPAGLPLEELDLSTSATVVRPGWLW